MARVLLALALLGAGALAAGAADAFTAARREMVKTQIAARGVRDPRVLDAMRLVERHRFVPEWLRDHAYEDRPLAIGHEPDHQPALHRGADDRGGAGQAGRPGAGDRHRLRLPGGGALGAGRRRSTPSRSSSRWRARPRRGSRRSATATSRVRAGDGYRGWPERAPFDAILVTAAPPRDPAAAARPAGAGRPAGGAGRRGGPGAGGGGADRGRPAAAPRHPGPLRPHDRRGAAPQVTPRLQVRAAPKCRDPGKMPTARADPLAAAGGLVGALLSVALLRFRCSLLGRQPRFGLGSLVTSSCLGRGTRGTRRRRS